MDGNYVIALCFLWFGIGLLSGIMLAGVMLAGSMVARQTTLKEDAKIRGRE